LGIWSGGRIRSEWKKEDILWRYEIKTPVDAVVAVSISHKKYYQLKELKKENFRKTESYILL